MSTVGKIALAVHLLAQAATAQSFVIDFAADENGVAMTAGFTDLRTFQPYANLFGTGSGLTLISGNPSTNPLNLYDSEGFGQADDLERNTSKNTPGQWDGGTELDTIFGNVLIVNRDNVITVPEDNEAGGEIILRFDLALREFAFDFIDMDSGDLADVTFTNRGTGASHLIAFTDFEAGSGSPFEAPDVEFGRRHANSIPGINASQLPGLSEFDEVVFSLRSGGALAGIDFDLVPEPALPSLLVLAALTILGPRRRLRSVGVQGVGSG